MIDSLFLILLIVWIGLGIMGVGGFKLYFKYKHSLASSSFFIDSFWWLSLCGPIAVLACVKAIYDYEKTD